MPATFGTVVNPTRKLIDYLSTHASNTLAKSLVAVTTPQYASQLKSLPEAFPKLQVVGFACDTVPLGCQRNGISWLVMENQLKIMDKMQLVNDSSRNWASSTAAVRITSSPSTHNKLAPSADFAIPAANTLFSTGNIAEIYAGSSGPLHSLHVDLQLPLQSSQVIRPVKELSSWLEITSSADNMLKSLDGGRAAQVLEQHELLQTAVDPQVFAEIQSTGEFIKVVAGGGGLWSPRSSMLVLEAPCQLRRGDRLRFWLQESKLNSDLESQLASTKSDSLVVEAAPIPQSLDEEKPYLEFKRDHYLPVFGFGSEMGFMVGDHKHSVVGESLCYSPSK